VVTYFGKKMADEKITFFEPYFVRTGDLENEVGFFIVKGRDEEIAKLVLDEEYLKLVERGFYCVEHLTVDYLTVGEGIGQQLARAEKVRELLKI
jgi:hypothetical protein